MIYLSELAKILGGRVYHSDGEEMFGSVCLDSRKARRGELFFALKGANLDGHDFVVDAFTKGAAAAVVERRIPIIRTQVVVEDTTRALGQLAQAYRMSLPARVIAVTGSNGKTTTKEMISHILAADSRVVRAPASYNNHVGLPYTILQATQETDYLVLEAGTNRKGEIAALADIARPDTACITGVGPAHLEAFGSTRAIAREKFSILKSIRGGGTGVVNVDSEELRSLLEDFTGRRVTVSMFSSEKRADYFPEEIGDRSGSVWFRLRGVTFELNLYGVWNIANALAACAVCHGYGVPLERCAERLATFRPPKMRMERLTIDGVSILNDAYNSNPLSAENALREFSHLPTDGRRIAVVGDMAELGVHSKKAHHRLGEVVSELGGIDQLIAVGEQVVFMVQAIGKAVNWRYFDNVHEAADYLMQVARPGDAVLLKGSRVMGLERVLEDWVRRETRAVG
jgi:UDP-N-acetylmuramoyl-tripeptide--D-alanyl-D-alanine ligase